MAFLSLPFTKLRSRAEAEINRLPDLILEADKAARTVFSGEHTHRKAGTGEHFWQYREYTPTDRPRDIDWRQSAKGDRVYVKQRELQTIQTAILWCAAHQGMAYRSDRALPTKRDTALILALAIAAGLSRQGETVKTFDSRAYKGQPDDITEYVGQDLVGEASPLTSLSHKTIAQGSTVFLFSDFLAPVSAVKDTLGHIAPRVDRGSLIQILDPAELTLPFTGRAIFEMLGSDASAPDNPKRYNIENVSEIRQDYIARITRHNEELGDIARHYGWSFIQHRTDRAYTATLLSLREWLASPAPQTTTPGEV